MSKQLSLAKKSSEVFFKDSLKLLLKSRIPFMVGGAYALQVHTGVHRKTKDFDIFTTKKDYPKILKLFSNAGYQTELTDSQWLAKVFNRKDFIDIIFADPHKFYDIDENWLHHASVGEILDTIVKIMSPEEMLISKLYRQRRLKYEGPDIMRLILKQGKNFDWKRIISYADKHWQLLFAHLLNYWFVYPSERNNVPKWVYVSLIERAQKEIGKPLPKKKVSRGIILSKSEYAIDVEEWGFQPEMHIRDI